MRKYMKFKKFDIVEDYSDHYYSKSKSSSGQPPINWAKKIQDEWRILERNLPDLIFVRVYEGRMDLLRAVIIGVDGTPYSDGLFFFDICFPKNYPKDPPQVYYHSGGLRINPNLYANGTVCLSLLNTWRGNRDEKWSPAISTMLQVLVSIQGMILNAKPYFNEPGYEALSGSVNGEAHSLQYNQQILITSLKTMVYTIKKPPKNFEDLVIGHFRDRATGIVTKCKDYYMKGMGDKYSIDVRDKTGYSLKLRKEVKAYMKTLVAAFKHIGGVYDDLDDYVPLDNENNTDNALQKKKKNIIQKILPCFDFE
ncbi:hypothetical protein QVD17_27207 [Tagetes erecta]|uniref:E2 ubiquitin-conjugating enzyme n=1 Tax=Tagetes erecta TaxID=13708 RepID=A0AAD8NRF3_TARER|nr:hypothetical protein QVD17_27207 [Tagetes erecta]